MVKKTDIPENKGKLVELGGKPCCLFKDKGDIKAFSPTCPHAACTVEWNDGASTWDCPCHGSRFEADGKLRKGPAHRDLERIEIAIENDEIRLKK